MGNLVDNGGIYTDCLGDSFRLNIDRYIPVRLSSLMEQYTSIVEVYTPMTLDRPIFYVSRVSELIRLSLKIKS